MPDYNLARLPSGAAVANFGMSRMDHTKIKGGTFVRPSAGVMNATYDYTGISGTGDDSRLKTAVFQNINVQKMFTDMSVGVSGQLYSIDENDERLIVGPYSARIIVRLPGGLMIGAAHYRQAVEAAYSLHWTTAAASATDLDVYNRLLSGNAAW